VETKLTHRAKEAAKAALKIGLKDLNLHRIEAVMENDHKASIAVARSIGMTNEGVRKRFLPTNDSKWEDAIVFASIN